MAALSPIATQRPVNIDMKPKIHAARNAGSLKSHVPHERFHKRAINGR
jgi:hypothetical protein